ncbi:MAG: radical SAM protein [Bacteroidetes bacterium]|nr:MAG: radical SAM protein [Bacteroidota bacterium]
MYKHLFGPVPSRRLGMSLGVDLIPHKICSLDCVYCECGPGTLVTLDRKEYVPTDEVVRELEDYFRSHPDPDYITFSGAGEPTLHIHFGKVLARVKELRPAVPVAVLTNGTLLSDPKLRGELMQADLVLPSLDAVTSSSLKKINRPHAAIDPEEYVNGLRKFGEEFGGRIWLEIFILPGFNDDEKNLLALQDAIALIKPDRVQLNTLDRPGAVKGLYPASIGQLEAIRARFGGDNVEIIAPPEDRNKAMAYRNDTEAVILETISRRPCTLNDLHHILGLHVNEINKYLGVLEAGQRIETVEEERGLFYQIRSRASSAPSTRSTDSRDSASKG